MSQDMSTTLPCPLGGPLFVCVKFRTISKLTTLEPRCCCLSEPKLFVRFDLWEQGNVSSLQLSDRLQGALRHALCDVFMELKVLPNPLCVAATSPSPRSQAEEAKGEFITHTHTHTGGQKTLT